MKQLKKVLAMILCLAMCLSMFPASAFAEEGAAEAPAEQAGEPVYEEPVYEEPVYEEPVYEEPVYEEPAYEEPVYEEPAYEEPVSEEPVSEEPACEEPVYEEPVNEEPVNQEPATAEPETPQPVRVIFEVPAEGAAVRVYTKDENLNETDVAAEEDGSFLLLPGQYYYRVNAEGYAETEEKEFTVEASEEIFTVAVEMTLSATGSDADSAKAALTVAQILTGTGVSYYIPEDDGTTNEALLTEYAAQQLEKAKPARGGMLMAPARPTSGLNDAQAEAYYILKEYITETAAGSRPLTQYDVTFDSDFISNYLTWTPETLPGGGYESFTEDNWAAAAEQGYEATMALGPIHTALLNNLPYELYWYDKTMGVMSSYSYSATQMSDGSITNVYITGITYIFTVAQAYSDGETYATDSSGAAIRNTNNGRAYPICVRDVGSTINDAVANAQAVVSSNSGIGDGDKLVAYKDYICGQVSYNHAAASDDYDLGYGDPWQLIYAFDNDSGTNIVCEGYSKAFEYLCDLSSFNDGNVRAYCVTGTMDGGTGAGAHMWNIVTMDDGRNYLVDVTNCDEGSVGAPDQLFLKGCASGNADEGYIFSCNDGASQIAYLYDSNTRNYYNTDELTVSAYDYGEAAPIEALQAACDAGENYILTESLTIPAELNLNVNQGTVITVPENMTLTVNGKLTFEGQSGLVVEQGGLAEIGNGGSIGINSRPDLTRISGTLSVGNGRLYVSRGVWENQSGGIYSANITAGEYGQIHIEGTVFTADGAGETMSRLEATTIPEGLRAAVRLDFNIMFAWTLEDSYILPEGINVCVKNSGGNENGSLTVSEGSRLTVPEGGALILEGAALEVNGELVNDGEIELRANRTGAASLTLNQGAAAWGNGEIRVRTAEDPQNWLQGFDPDELILVSSSDSETVYRFAVALTDNTSFETAIELTEDQLFDVTGSAEGVTRYYKFTPAESSYYGLKMNEDSVLWVQMVNVFGADRSYVGSGDQYSGPYVYQLPYLTAGETYYIVIQIGDEGTASFELCWDNHLRAYPADDAWETLVPYGESAVLRVTAEGADLSNLSYEWRDGEGNTIAGETADTLTTAAITGRTTYYCVVTDQYGNTASAHFEVGIDNALTATAADGITELKLPMGAAFTLSVNVTALNPEGMTYRWTKWGDGVEYTELTETGTSLTDTVSGRLYYQFTVQDQYENYDYVMFQISVDNQLQAWVEGTDGSDSQNFYLKPGETATMKAAVSAAQSENMSYRWNWEVYYTNGHVETDSMSGSLQMTSMEMPEAVDYVHYTFQVQDTYHNYASVHYWLKPFTYSCGVNGDNVTWSFDESTGVLTFSGTGDMADSVGAWEMYKDRITAVVFTDGVTGVGAETFSSFTGITSVSLPEGVRSIAYSGFEGCTGLTEVTLPDSLEEIGSAAFAGSGLTGITIPDNVRTIAYSSFEGCTDLTAVTLPDSLEEIGSSAFAGSGLTGITIPDNVRTIEYSSFEGCSSLSAVNLPANLEEIGERAFADNTSLTEITIPVTTARILPYAFSGCVNLQTVNYPGTQEQWDAIEIGEGNYPLLNAELILGGQTDPTTDALPAPTNLIWNQGWHGGPENGMAHFEYESGTKLNAVVSFYRNGEEQAIFEGDQWVEMVEQPEGSGKWRCHSAWFRFNSRELESGSYFFMVKLVAGTEESELATSGDWTYTAPSVSVPSPEVNGIVYTDEKELVPDFTLVGSDYAQGPQFILEYRPNVNSEEGSSQKQFSYRPDLDPVDEAKKSMNETMSSEGYGEGWYRIGVMVNSSDITVAKNSETVYSEWQFISAGKIAGTEELSDSLPAPTNLIWNQGWHGHTENGMAHFEYESATKLDAVVNFYRVGEEQAIYEGNQWVTMVEQSEGSGKWLCHSAWFRFNSRDLESGSYYFTVKLVADNGEESEIATSPSWTYTAPTGSVPSPVVNGIVYTDAKELEPDFTVEATSYRGSPKFTLEFRHTEDSDSVTEEFQYSTDYDTFLARAKAFMNETMQSDGFGEGWYRFGVMVNSSDITQAKNSETVYSEWQFVSEGQIAGTEESGPLGALRAAIARGDSSFTLRDNLTIPAAEGVYGDNIALIISDGTTLTLEGALTVGTLTVNGEIIVIGSDMNTALAVRSNLAFGENGTLRVPSPGPFIELDGGSSSRNYSNYFSGIVPHLDLADGASVIFGYGVGSESDIHSVLSDLYNHDILNDGRFRQDLQLQTNVTLSGDLYLPANASLHTDCVWNSDTLTVAEGASLTLENGSWLYAFSSDTVVEGSLYNEGEIILGVQVDTGTVSSLILSGGSYEGNGEIRVQTAENPMHYLQGFNPDELVVVRSGDGETVYRVAGEAAEENSVELVRIETDEYGNVTATLRVSTTAELADSWYTYGVQISNRPDLARAEGAYSSTYGGMAMNTRYNGEEVDFDVWIGDMVPGATYYLKAILQNGSYNEEYGYFEYTDIVAEGETVLSFTAPGSDADFTPIELGDSAAVHQYDTSKFLFTAPADGLYALTGSANYIGAFSTDGGAKNNPVWMDGQNPTNSVVFYAAAEEKVYLFARANFGDGTVQLVNADQVVMNALVLNSATPVDSGTTVRYTAAAAGHYKIAYSPVNNQYGLQLMDAETGSWTYYSGGFTVKLAAGESAYLRPNYNQSQGQLSVKVTKVNPPTADSVAVAAAKNVTNCSAEFPFTYSITEATSANGYAVGIETAADRAFTQINGMMTWMSSNSVANNESLSVTFDHLYPGQSFWYRAILLDPQNGNILKRGSAVYQVNVLDNLNGYTQLTKDSAAEFNTLGVNRFWYVAENSGMLAIRTTGAYSVSYTLENGQSNGLGGSGETLLLGCWAEAGQKVYINVHNNQGRACTVEVKDALGVLPAVDEGSVPVIRFTTASYTAQNTGLHRFTVDNDVYNIDFMRNDGVWNYSGNTCSLEMTAGETVWLRAMGGATGTGAGMLSGEYVDPNVILENLKTAIANGESYFDLRGLISFTLTESLTIPENMHVDFWGTQLQVPAGVKLTVLGSMRGEFTEIGGTVEVRGGDLYQKGILFTDNDAVLDLNSRGGASMPVDSWTSDVEAHVSFGEECYLNLNDEANSAAELNAAKRRIAEPKAHVIHWININFPWTVSIPETIPQNAVYEFADNGMLLVEQDVTLNVLGGLKIRGTTAELGGKINNEGWIEVAANDSGTMGMVHLMDSGSYTGAGELRVMTAAEPQTWLHGFNRDYLQEKWSDANGVCYVYTMGVFDALEAACKSGADWYGLNDIAALSIARDLTIPANMHLDAWNAVITVPEGVTLTVNGAVGMKGVMVEDGGTLRFGDGAHGTITESIECGDTAALELGREANLDISVSAWNQRSFQAGIDFADESAKIWLCGKARSDEELENALGGLSAVTLPAGQEDHFGKIINIYYGWMPANGFIMDADINWHIINNGDDLGAITVEPGSTLMMNGYLCLQGAAMEVNGKLYNNGMIDLQTENGTGSVLSLGPDGEYAGDGEVRITHGESESGLFGFTDYTLATLREDEESVSYRIVEGLVQEDVIFSEDAWDITATSAQLRVGLCVTEATAAAGDYVWGIKYSTYSTDYDFDEDNSYIWGWNVESGAQTLNFRNHDLCTLIPGTDYAYKAVLCRISENGDFGEVIAEEGLAHYFRTAEAAEGEFKSLQEGMARTVTQNTHQTFTFDAAEKVYYAVSGKNLDYICIKDLGGRIIPFFHIPSDVSGDGRGYAFFAVSTGQTVYIATGNHGTAQGDIMVAEAAKTAAALSYSPFTLKENSQAVKFTAPLSGWYDIAVTGSEAGLAMVDFESGTWYSPGTACNVYLTKGEIWFGIAGGAGATLKVTRAGSDLAENLAYLGTQDIGYDFNLNDVTVITDAVTVPRNVRLIINAPVTVQDGGTLINYGDIAVKDEGCLWLGTYNENQYEEPELDPHNGGKLIMIDGSDDWYATVSLEGGSVDVSGGEVTYGDRSMMVIKDDYYDSLSMAMEHLRGISSEDKKHVEFDIPVYADYELYQYDELSDYGRVKILMMDGLEQNLDVSLPKSFCLVVNEDCSVIVGSMPGNTETNVYGDFILEGGSLINETALNLYGQVIYQNSNSHFENNGTLNVAGRIRVNSAHEGNTTGTLYNNGTISLTGGTIEPEVTVVGSEPQTIECVAIDEENFPDDSFRNYVLSTIDSNRDGQLSDEEIGAVTEIRVDEMEIGSLRGIEIFTGLQVLSASGNNLTELDLSANTALTDLNVSGNRLTSLNLGSNTALTTLNVGGNQLTELDLSANTALTDLDVSSNRLTSLNLSNCPNLSTLNATGNSLTRLDLRSCPNIVEVSYDETVHRITKATEIEITEAKFPDAVFRDFIKGFNTDGSTTDVEEYGLYGDSIIRSVETLDASEIAAVEEGIDVSGKGIASLQGIELFTGLRSLKAANNNLTGLDLSGNADLVILDVSGNRLTTLNISGCPALLDVVQKGTMLSQDGITRNWFETAEGELKRDTSARLITGKGVEISMANFPDANFRAYVAENFDLNGTGTLDADEIANATAMNLNETGANLKGIEYFPGLKILFFYNSALTTLDLSANQQLETLVCENNDKLTTVDLSQNTALKTLQLHNNNKLNKLDLSANGNLEVLGCGNLALTALNLSQNTALNGLEVRGNKISNLDLSKNTNLKNAVIWDTPLTAFTPSVALENLRLNNTRLARLNLSSCVDLESLTVTNNASLTVLDVSSSTKLNDLDCSGNRLAKLDVSANGSLYSLDCSNNQLTALTLGENNSLGTLNCSGNPKLANLDLDGCEGMKTRLSSSDRIVTRSNGIVTVCVSGQEILICDDTTKLNLTTEELRGTCGAAGDGSNLSWMLDQNGTLSISGSGAMKSFASADEAPWSPSKQSGIIPALQEPTAVKKVEIGSAVTTIGSYAFASCENLEEVHLTGKMPTIGTNAFEGITATVWYPGTLDYTRANKDPDAYGAAELVWTAEGGFDIWLDPNGGYFKELSVGEPVDGFWYFEKREDAPAALHKQKTFGEAGVTMPLAEPEREGYTTFLGWANAATAGAPNYKPGAAFKENANKTLYAVWKADTFTVSFNSNLNIINESRALEGEDAVSITGTMRAQTLTVNKAAALTANAFRFTGNSFVGWALTEEDALNGAVAFTDRESVTDLILLQKMAEHDAAREAAGEAKDFEGFNLYEERNVTLYAVWKPTATGVSLYSLYDVAIGGAVTLVDDLRVIAEGDTLLVDMKEIPAIDLFARVNPYEEDEEQNFLSTVSANQNLKWTTSSTAIATVDENGAVSFLKPGTVTITATTTDGSNKRATVKFSIYYIDPGNRLTASLAETSATYAVATSIGLQQGDTAQLNIYGTDTTTPLNPDLFQYDITTRDGKEYLKFESNGQVTAKQREDNTDKSVSIKATLLNDPLKRTVTVNIKTIAPQTKEIDMTNANVTLEDGAIYLEKKTTAQTITITPIVKDAAGQKIPLERGRLTYASTNRAAAAPTETSSGAVTVTIPANATGAATITATSKDYAKTVGSLSIYVMDYEPRTDVKSVTIDTHMGTTAEIPLVVSNGNEITEVVFKEYVAASRDYQDLGRIEAELNTDDPTTAKVTLRANTGIANSTIKGQLEVTTKRYDKIGNTVVNTYPYDLNVVSKSTLPAITVRQTPLNTFYKDSESTVTVTARNTQIEEVKFIASTPETIFKSGESYTDGENTVLTIRFDDTQDNGDSKNIFPPNGSTNPFNPTAAQKNGILSIKLEGYVNPVQQPISIQTNNVRPALKLSAASTSLNTALDGDTVTVTLLDSKTNLPYPLEISSDVVNDPDQKQLYVTEETKLATVRLATDSNPCADLDITLNDNGKEKGGRVTMSVQDDNWTQAITYPFNVTVNTQLPRLTLAQTTLTLNKRFPGDKGIIAATEVRSNQAGTDLSAIEFSELTENDVKPAEGKDLIAVDYDGNSKEIRATLIGNPKANSTYTFTFHPTYKGTPLQDVSVRVNVNDQQPTATLTPNSVSLSAFSIGGEQQTVIKLNNDLVSVDDVEPTLTTRNVPDLFDIECVGDNNLIVSYKPGVEIYTYKENNTTVIRYNGEEIPARATSYTYQLTPILSEGENQTARPVNLTIRTIDDRPTLRAAKTSFTLNSAFGTADSTAISLVNVPGQTITALEWTANNTAAEAKFNNLSFEESFAEDGGVSGLTIRIAETDKTTYSVPVRLVALVQREDGATIESKPLVINVRAVNTTPNVTLASPTLTINRKLAVPAISTIKVPEGYDFVGFTEMEETGVYGDGNAILTLSKGRLQARLTQSAIDANRNGSYPFNLTPIVMDINTGITAECRTLRATVSNTSSDTWRINVAPSGKLDTVQRFSDEGKMIYTITGMNGIQGIPTSASLENVGDGRYASLFNVSGVQINDRGQAYVVLSLKDGVDYPTIVNYNKLKLRFTFADGTGEGIQVDSQELSLRATQTALRLTAKESKQTVYQSQAKTRTVTYEIELTSPIDATMNDLNVTVGDIRQWQSALENPDEDIFFELKKNSYGRTLLVHVTLKDLAQLAAGRNYTLPILVKAEGAASNMAATTVNLSLAVQK